MRRFIIALCSHIYLLQLVLLLSLVLPASSALEFDWQQLPFLDTQTNQTDNTPRTMKEAIILKGPEVKIVDTPIPKAEKGQIVVKVVYSGSNPKDWVRGSTCTDSITC